MANNRHKDRDWSDAPNTMEFGTIRVLMDIRDELQKLNRVFECGNFLRIPRDLAKIRAQTNRIPPRKPRT